MLISGRKGIGKKTLANHLINFIFSQKEEFKYDYTNKEINPLMYLLVDANTGIIHMICDPALSASDIQARIRALGSAVGPNNIDVTGTTAAAVTGITLT